MDIRWLTLADAPVWLSLRIDALRAGPGIFSASVQDAVDGGLAYAEARVGLRSPVGGVLGAFEADALVGAAGWRRVPDPKAAHRAFVWGMFVQPTARRQGIGRALMRRLIDHVRTEPDLLTLQLAVTSDAPGARALYESLGFELWGHERAALRVDGRLIDELHYALMLG